MARWQQLQPVPAPVACMTDRKHWAVPSITAQRISDSAIPRQRHTIRSAATISAMLMDQKPQGRVLSETESQYRTYFRPRWALFPVESFGEERFTRTTCSERLSINRLR